MNELKVGFSRLRPRQITELALRVHTALTTSPGNGYFPSPDPTPAALKTAHDALENSLSLETTTSSAALRKSNRDTLVELLNRLAANLELVANGDLVKLSASGFDLKKTPGGRSNSNLPAPGNVRVTPTGITGQALLKCKAIPGSDNYQAECSLNVGGPWTAIDPSSSSQQMLFTGLFRGKDYYFRVRANGSNGPGPWSDIATMMVV